MENDLEEGTCWMTNIKDWVEMGRYKECARAARDMTMCKKIVEKVPT